MILCVATCQISIGQQPLFIARTAHSTSTTDCTRLYLDGPVAARFPYRSRMRFNSARKKMPARSLHESVLAQPVQVHLGRLGMMGRDARFVTASTAEGGRKWGRAFTQEGD